MQTRSDFLISAGAAALATSIPLAASADGPTAVTQPLAYPGFGTVRYLSLPIPGKAPILVTAATMDRNHLRASIAALPIYNFPAAQLAMAARRAGATVAINGGFFDMSTLLPIGLLTVNGQRFGMLDQTLSGAIAVDAAGVLSVVPAAQAVNANSAIQTGPFLIDPGGTIGIASDRDSQLVHRSFVAQSGDTIVAGVSSNVILRDLAKALHDYHDAFASKPFDAAVNLSGSATSGIVTGPNDAIVPERTEVRVRSNGARDVLIKANAAIAKAAPWGTALSHSPGTINRSAILFAQRFT